LVGRIAVPSLPLSGAICVIAFWALLGLNMLLFTAALAGLRRLGPIRLGISSGGVAGVELRDAFGRK